MKSITKFSSKGYLLSILILLLFIVITEEQSFAQETWEYVNKFIKQADIILVYGTANPEKTDFMRKQAKMIADGYKQNSGYFFQVKADKEIGKKDIENANLFLIGTPSTNGILKELLPELPIRFEEDGYIFGGKKYTEKDKLIRFLYPNPLNPHKLMGVYTGNDDFELKPRYAWVNFMVIGLGGEYSITQQTFVIRSGFFKKEGNKWIYDVKYDKDNEKNLKNYFDTIRLHKTKHYNLYYYADSPVAPYIEKIGKLKEKEYTKHFSLLKQPIEDCEVTIYYFESVDQMLDVKAASNDPAAGYLTFIFASFNDIVGWGTHEDMHPLSYQILGPVSSGSDVQSPLLGEGIACLVQGDGVWHGKPVEYWTVKFLIEDTLPTLKNYIVGNRLLNWLITYPTDAHFAKFFFDRYGAEKFKKLWNSENLEKDIPIVLGVSLQQLEQQWHEAIRSLENQYQDKIKAGRIFELALTYYYEEDFAAAEIKFQNALKYDPKNSEIHYFLARSYCNQTSYEKAEESFKSYLNSEKPPEYEWMTPHTYLNLGIIADIKGNRQQAINYYKKVLEFPPERKSHEYAGRGIERQLKFEDLAKAYDLPFLWPYGIHIPAFRPELMGGPSSNFSYCLYYIKKGEFDKTLKYFDRALWYDKEDPDILFYFGITKFELGEYKEALKIFDQILSSNRKALREYIPTLIHLYKGKIYDKLNDLHSAQSEYKIVLTLPDWRNAHKKAKEYLENHN